MTLEATKMEESIDSHKEAINEEEFIKEKQEEKLPEIEKELKNESTEEKQEAKNMEAIVKSSSFKEESNFLNDLKENEKKALFELQSKLAQELDSKEASLWGVSLLSKADDAAKVILLKFLRAREFKVKESFEMIEKTLKWRKDEKIGSLIEEDMLGCEFESSCYVDGYDREGHPICYNAFSVFQNEDLYGKTFGNDRGRKEFLRWRVQKMEKGIKMLDLKPNGVSSLLQIFDLKDSIGFFKLRDAVNEGLQVLQDNYPEFVAGNIFVNVPFWYYTFYALLSPFLTQRTKSKFIIARPAQVTETLLKYIAPETIPICYGGFKRENDSEFSVEDGKVSELIVRSNSTESIELPATEIGTTVIWDIVVLGGEVSYKEEFVPSDEGSYTVIIQKQKKISGSQEEAIRKTFRNNEPGKVVITIANKTSKKKNLLYRYKTKSS